MPGKIFDRALVIRGGALGDLLLTLPVLRALRGASARLEVLAYPQFVQLAREAELVDGGRSIEYGPLAGFFARGAVQDPALRDYLASFDPVVSYLYDPDGIFAENLRTAGVNRLVRGPHKPEGKCHAIDELASPLGELGLKLEDRAAGLRPSSAHSEELLVAIHPGSGSPAKNWPASNWNALATRLLAEHPRLRIAIIGGEADRSPIEALAQLRAQDRAEFWEHLPLVELARRLGTARAYIGHDTGVSHLAAAAGIPSLLLFGPTDPAVWAPPHPHVAAVRAADGDLPGLGVATVFSAAQKNLLTPLLASARARQQNPPA